MGYVLSKPYVLKIFDAKLQMKLTFADLGGICKLFSRSSPDCKVLQNVCPEEEVALLAKAKIENIIVKMMQCALKGKAPGSSAGRLEEQEALLDGLKCFFENSSKDTSVFSALTPVLFVALSAVNCKRCNADDLDNAITVLDEA